MNAWQLLEFYQSPAKYAATMNGADWSQLVHIARDSGLGATLLPKLQALDFPFKEKVLHHAQSYFCFAEKQYLSVIKELLELESVFEQCNYPVLLVKGVAYRIALFDYARYRLFSDIDLLIPPQHFKDAIKRLKDRGYIEQNASEYERNYYLNWSHQYPPLRHFMRTAELDVHHTIFFARSRVQIDINTFVARATPIENSVFSIPAAADMFIHACLHLFYQEENQKLLKDLIDLHCLYQQIEDKTLIIQSADISNKKSAIAYGLMVQQWLFKQPLSAEELLFIKQYSSKTEVKWIQWLIRSMLQDSKLARGLASQLWYMRGHLIKMSFPTLVYHSCMKAYHSYQQQRRLGKQQKIIDAETLPKDAR